MSLRSILKPKMGGQQDFVFGAAQKLEEDYGPPLCPPPSWICMVSTIMHLQNAHRVVHLTAEAMCRCARARSGT
jgi:hypothetical protein